MGIGATGRLARWVGAVAFVMLLGVVLAGSAGVHPAGAAAGGRVVARGLRASATRDTHKEIRHVWLIMLENHSFEENFGEPAKQSATKDSMAYLSETLPSEGALLANYYGIAHPSNSNYTALVSGQPPSVGFVGRRLECLKTVDFCLGTQFDCPYYTNFGLEREIDAQVAVGQGCVYPTRIPDIGTQLRSAGLTVKAYEEDMPKPCDHPGLGEYDQASASLDPGYETGNNPFLYFHNWIDNHKLCQQDDVPLGHNTFEPLVNDLKSIDTTPNLSWIGLNLCDSGHDRCPLAIGHRNSDSFFRGAEICHGNVAASEECNGQSSVFLSLLIPKIMASPAYKQDGLIAIVWDEANFYTTSPYADYRACCDEPNEPGASGQRGVTGQFKLLFHKVDFTPGAFRKLGAFGDTGGGVLGFLKALFSHDGLEGQPGGGNSGGILLSPFIKGGTVSDVHYNHYSLLATIQRIFGVARTGNAADPHVRAIGSDVSGVFPAG